MKQMKLSAFVLTLLLAASLPAAAGSVMATRDSNIRMEMNRMVPRCKVALGKDLYDSLKPRLG
jgi:hypothetical protein